MSLLERIQRLFSRPELPEQTRQLFSRARSTRELLAGLDELLTRNEIELGEIDREIERLERAERHEAERVRSGEVQGRNRRNTLYRIQRLRKQMDLCEGRARIYRHNIELHMRLIDRIQQLEAMALRGVGEAEIEQIALRFDEEREKFEETVHAGAALTGETPLGASREERELAALEREILGESRPAEAPEGELSVEPTGEPAIEANVQPLPPAGFETVVPPIERAPEPGIEAEGEAGSEAAEPRTRRLELE
ncbi:MAG: hypothetical protein D6776_01505 [Planctomycetota bacterium]|nr:MAG: hypothetical protein D6776_01505 [Planctomycetota bacterium]